MREISEYFISLLLCALLGLAPCQAQEQDTLREKREVTYNSRFIPSAVRIGLSLKDGVRTLTDPQGTYWGVQADIPVRQFMISMDYGQARMYRGNTEEEQPGRNFQYAGKGSFFRFGVDANLLQDRKTGRNDARGDVIYFGLKYAHSRLDDQLTFNTGQGAVFNTTTVTQSNKNLGVWWLEMNAGMKVEVLKNIFLGYALRYKFFRRFGGRGSLLPYEVPGFGKGENENTFGFDYYIFYRIPFKK